MNHDVKFLRVLSMRARDPGVMAAVDGYLVKWHPAKGWDCQCRDDASVYECEHIEVVRGLLHENVTTKQALRPRR